MQWLSTNDCAAKDWYLSLKMDSGCQEKILLIGDIHSDNECSENNERKIWSELSTLHDTRDIRGYKKVWITSKTVTGKIYSDRAFKQCVMCTFLLILDSNCAYCLTFLTFSTLLSWVLKSFKFSSVVSYSKVFWLQLISKNRCYLVRLKSFKVNITISVSHIKTLANFH